MTSSSGRLTRPSSPAELTRPTPSTGSRAVTPGCRDVGLADQAPLRSVSGRFLGHGWPITGKARHGRSTRDRSPSRGRSASAFTRFRSRGPWSDRPAAALAVHTLPPASKPRPERTSALGSARSRTPASPARGSVATSKRGSRGLRSRRTVRSGPMAPFDGHRRGLKASFPDRLRSFRPDKAAESSLSATEPRQATIRLRAPRRDAVNERSRRASSRPSPRPEREAGRRGRGRSAPWRAAGCRPSARRS